MTKTTLALVIAAILSGNEPKITTVEDKLIESPTPVDISQQKSNGKLNARILEDIAEQIRDDIPDDSKLIREGNGLTIYGVKLKDSYSLAFYNFNSKNVDAGDVLLFGDDETKELFCMYEFFREQESGLLKVEFEINHSLKTFEECEEIVLYNLE